MIQALSLTEFKSLAKTAKRVTVFEQVNAQNLSIPELYEILHEKMQDPVIFENLFDKEKSDFICHLLFDPIATLTVERESITQKVGADIQTCNAPPFAALRALKKNLQLATREDVANKLKQVAGFVTYDAIRFFESIPDRHFKDALLPEMLFNFYRVSLALNPKTNELLIGVMAEISDDLEKNYKHARDEIKHIAQLLHQQPAKTIKSVENFPPLAIEVDITDEQFKQKVIKAKEYIVRGDAFQVVLSRSFTVNYTVSPFNIYKTLRTSSPAPYLFYFTYKNSAILGASPEKFIQVKEKQVFINPIAGTRKRPALSNDAAITQDLLTDAKEMSEHIMLVDLARNDMGAVVEPGSIQIPELFNVKHYSHVSHITSTVSGKLRDDLDALDAFTAAFPAGTLSGAPKIRAMEIIDELEVSRRHIYGGAICSFDYADNLESCIAIRTGVFNNGTATIRAGGGIVYESSPEGETAETIHKAKAMLDAIQKAHENTLCS